jgi:hypothetical protein
MTQGLDIATLQVLQTDEHHAADEGYPYIGGRRVLHDCLHVVYSQVKLLYDQVSMDAYLGQLLGVYLVIQEECSMCGARGRQGMSNGILKMSQTVNIGIPEMAHDGGLGEISNRVTDGVVGRLLLRRQALEDWGDQHGGRGNAH